MRKARTIYFTSIFMLFFSLNGFAMKRAGEEKGIEDDPRYIELCTDKIIKSASNSTSNKAIKFIDLEMNEVKIVSTKDNANLYLGSYGFANCLAIAAWGNTAEGEKFLGFSHISSFDYIKATLKNIKSQLEDENNKCLPESIEFFVIGSYPHFYNEQKEFLNNVVKYKNFNIKEIKFNISGGDDDDSEQDYYVELEDREQDRIYGEITVVISQEGVFYSKNDNFSVFQPEE